MNKTFLLIGIILLGLILRIIGIFNLQLTFDEAHNILLARSNNLLLMTKAALDAHPPLYFFISHFWQLLFPQYLYSRLLAIFFGVAAMISIAYIGKKLFNYRVGLIASFLVAIAPSQIYYSSTARMYSMAILISIYVIYTYIKFHFQKSNIYPFIISMLLGIYTHFFFIILLLSLNIYELLNWRVSKKIRKKWIISNC